MTAPAQGMMDNANHSDRASKILVVDDEEIIRALLSEILTDEGFEVTTACDGREAIGLLNKEQFDLVISDMVMPIVGGIEVLQEAFRIDPDYAVIIITGYPSVDTAVKLVNLGAADYITKPFNVDIIKITVAKVLEMKRMRGGPPEAESSSAGGGIDAATGVYSDGIFFQLLSNEVGRSKLRNQPCSLLILSVEDFNPSLFDQNPEAANRILKNVAEMAERLIRPGDTIGRTDEAEFGLILPQTEHDEAKALSYKLCQGTMSGFTLRSGIACHPRDGEDAQSLIATARAAINIAIR